MVLQDLQVNQAIQRQINDRLRTGSEPLDPVLGVPLNGFARNFLQDGVQDGVARLRLVQKDQGLHIRVNARVQRQFREYGADDGAVQIPAGYLAKVAALFVEEHQDELVGQTERLGDPSFRRDSQEFCPRPLWGKPKRLRLSPTKDSLPYLPGREEDG